MGIDNINILFSESDDAILRQARQAREAIEAQRIAEHQRGEHPWGSMRRDCPYCVSGK